MSGTMPALVVGAGRDWELRTVERPEPGPGQVLVRVRAAGLNRADLAMLQGRYPGCGRSADGYTAGLELAGEVAAVGDDVGEGAGGVAPGDRVMAAALGSFATYALVDHRHLMPVPEGLSWTDAGGLPVAIATEHDALGQAGLRAGDRVVIVGATSGVGMLGVQLAKALGASLVVATTRSPAKAGSLRAVGADVVVDPTTEDLPAAVGAATDGRGADVVIDHVGGDRFGDLLPATRVQGTIVNVGRLGGPRATVDLDQLAFRRLRILGTTFSIRTAEERAEVYAAVVREALPTVADGRVHPIVDRVVPFDRVQEAAARMRSNEAVGKIVLEMPG
jgi:NADPH:quinone reductase-like Zn-dependent oxidoreductase